MHVMHDHVCQIVYSLLRSVLGLIELVEEEQARASHGQYV